MRKRNLLSDNDIYVTPSEAAEILNVSLSTLKKFIYSGKMVTLKTPGGHHRIRKADLYRQISQVLEDKSLSDLTDGEAEEQIWECLRALEGRQTYMPGHSEAVARLSVRVAGALGYPRDQMDRLRLAALAHDIGLVGLSAAVINKPSTPNAIERTILQSHPVIGEQMLKNLMQVADIGRIVRHHHERVDGKGYPDGLYQKDIAEEARIIAVTECYDCLTRRSSYRSPMTSEAALREIREASGTQFDPVIVDALADVLPVG